MARPRRLNGGCKSTFPSHVADGLLNLVSIGGVGERDVRQTGAL